MRLQRAGPGVWDFLLRHGLGPPGGFPGGPAASGGGGGSGGGSPEHRPVWSQPSPSGPPIARGAGAAEEGRPPGQYGGWRLYPIRLTRPPSAPRPAPCEEDAESGSGPAAAAESDTCRRLGDKASSVGDYWVARGWYMQAAREAGYRRRPPGEADEARDDAEEVQM